MKTTTQTKTWPYGTTRRATVQKTNWRPVGIPNHVGSGQLLIDDLGEAHICIGGCGDEAASVGDTGTLTFTKGGPTGGYWKFQRDVRRSNAEMRHGEKNENL